MQMKDQIPNLRKRSPLWHHLLILVCAAIFVDAVAYFSSRHFPDGDVYFFVTVYVNLMTVGTTIFIYWFIQSCLEIWKS